MGSQYLDILPIPNYWSSRSRSLRYRASSTLARPIIHGGRSLITYSNGEKISLLPSTAMKD